MKSFLSNSRLPGIFVMVLTLMIAAPGSARAGRNETSGLTPAEIRRVLMFSTDESEVKKASARNSELMAKLRTDIVNCLEKYSCIPPSNTVFEADDILKLQAFKSNDVLEVMDRMLGIRDGNEALAAEVLFAIGTPESQKILDRHLLTPGTDIRIAPWDFRTLNPTLRTAFAYQYCLKPLAGELDVALKVRPGSATNKMDISIAVRNVSQRIFSIPKPSLHPGRHLTLISEEEKLATPLAVTNSAAIAGPEALCLSMVPGEVVQIKFTAAVQQIEQISTNGVRSTTLTLDCGDYSFQLPQKGRYKIYATFDYRRTGTEPTDDFWEGRVISNPVEFDLQPQPALPTPLKQTAP